MTDEEALDFLQDQARTLEKEINDNDYHIERWTHALANAEEPGHAIEGLRDYHNRQYGLMFELGKIEARIEDLQNRIREHDERERERASVENWEREVPVSPEDRLAWLELDDVDLAVEREDNEHERLSEAEDRMLDEMHRGDREPEDYEDWRGR